MPFETDKSGGFKVDASDLLKTGVYPERFDKQIPFWETVNGVQYTEFGMRRKAGRVLKHDFTDAPQSSTTEIRGITATREYDDRVAYVADLQNIYSYRASNSAVATVGSGYNLLKSSSGTEWGAAAGVSSVTKQPGQANFVVGVFGNPGWLVGDTVNVSGVIYQAINPNGDHVLLAVTFIPFTNITIIEYAAPSTNSEVYSNFNNALVARIPAPGEDPDITLWDVSTGGTTWDFGVNEADLWDFDTFGNFIVGAKGSSKPVIKKNNVNFNTFYSNEVSGGTITVNDTGGSNYNVGDQLLATGGSGTGLTATVIKTSGGAIVDFAITNFGSGYSNGDVITFSGGTISATATLTVPDIDFDTLECFHKQGPHMLAFNYSKSDVNYSTSFAWCSADNLDVWGAAATNTAGSLLIREAETPIRCVAQLGNGLAVYTDTQMFIVNYVGLPNIFGYQVALEGNVGAVSPQSVISVGRQNYGVSRDGFFVTDGAQVNLIGRESGMNQFFRDNVSASELALVYGYENSKENEVVWGLPLGTSSINKEIYYNYKTGQWGMRDSLITAYLDRGILETALSGDLNGKFYFEGGSASLDLPFRNVYAITKAHDLNDADRIKEISAIRVGKEGTGSPTLSVGWSETVDATPNYTRYDGQVNSFVIDDTFKSFPIRSAGRYITIKIESNGNTDDWTLTNLVVQGRMEGER